MRNQNRDRNTGLPYFRIFAHGLILVVAVLSSSCGKEQNGGDWLGTIYVVMREGEFDPNVGNNSRQFTVFRASDSVEYVLLIPDEATKVAVSAKSGNVTIALGETYRIRGSQLDKPEELQVAAQFGFDRIILVSYIELMDGPEMENGQPTNRQVELTEHLRRRADK